ncbi:MAG: TnpV protein [Clostridiales bacterium]|nr:MAG: TnpV protein [Clostridiales bacterium]
MTEFEKLGGTYRQVGDYFLPNLEIDNQVDVQIGVWGQRHRQYVKEHHRVRYYNLLTTGMLNDYLAEIESRAQAMFDMLVRELSEKENLTEKLKASDPMEWVRRSNNLRNRATEIVNAEVIFV